MRSAYSYTVLRYVHDIASGEFVNVGVVLCAPGVPFVGALCTPSARRASSVFPDLNVGAFNRLIKQVASQVNEVSDKLVARSKAPDSVMTLAHGVVPADDSGLQWSPPGGGLTTDPAKTLGQLYARLVARYEEQADQLALQTVA